MTYHRFRIVEHQPAPSFYLCPLPVDGNTPVPAHLTCLSPPCSLLSLSLPIPSSCRRQDTTRYNCKANEHIIVKMNNIVSLSLSLSLTHFVFFDSIPIVASSAVFAPNRQSLLSMTYKAESLLRLLTILCLRRVASSRKPEDVMSLHMIMCRVSTSTVTRR